jgi:DNA-binding IclR family transcriptional regulator
MSSASKRLYEALDVIGSERGGVAVTDLARELDVSMATASRLLASLVDAGFVTKTDSQRHVLDLRLWVWGVQASAGSRRIAEIARPMAIHVVGVTDALIATTILYKKLALFLEVMLPSHGATVVLPGGKIIPAYACAPGKAILAYANPDRQREALQGPLKAYTAATLTSMEELQREFAVIREKGYALNRSEYYADTVGVAVPIFDGNGEVLAAVSSSGLTTSWDIERLEGLVPHLRSISDSASAALGYSRTANMFG